MIDYNLILFIGCGLIIFGFSLFLYSEMKERELDIKLFELEQKIKEEEDTTRGWASIGCMRIVINRIVI